MMAGSSMTISTDEGHGQVVGSKISLSGTVLGIKLTVDEVVTQRQPPWSKTWETIGAPRLLVIRAYVMGFVLARHAGGTLLRVFIDYDLPTSGGSRWLGRLFGRTYAKWCTARMTADAGEYLHSYGARLGFSVVDEHSGEPRGSACKSRTAMLRRTRT